MILVTFNKKQAMESGTAQVLVVNCLPICILVWWDAQISRTLCRLVNQASHLTTKYFYHDILIKSLVLSRDRQELILLFNPMSSIFPCPQINF